MFIFIFATTKGVQGFRKTAIDVPVPLLLSETGGHERPAALWRDGHLQRHAVRSRQNFTEDQDWRSDLMHIPPMHGTCISHLNLFVSGWRFL